MDFDNVVNDIEKLPGLNIYEQYKSDDVYNEMFKKLKQYIFNNYFKDLINNYNKRFPSVTLRAYVDSDENKDDLMYLLYHYTNIYGFYSPLGKAQGAVLYDDLNLWDRNKRWDDIKGNGFIPIQDYIKLITHFLNYEHDTWRYGWLYNLIVDYVKTYDFILEPTIEGVIVHCMRDNNNRLQTLSNIFTEYERFSFTPIQRVKFIVYYEKQELDKKIKEIHEIYKDSDINIIEKDTQ